MTTSGKKPRILVVRGWGGGPVEQVCASLSKIAEIVLVNVDTGHSTSETDEASARRAIEGRGELIQFADPLAERHRVIEAVARHPVDAIYTPSAFSLEYTAGLAHELGLAFPSPDAVARTRDKFAQRSALAAGGVPCPRFAKVRNAEELEDAIAQVPMPVVLKPEKGCAGVDTYRVGDPNELRRIYRQAVVHLDSLGLMDKPEFIVEELLIGVVWHDDTRFGDYCSVESFVLDGEVTHALVTDRMPLAPPFREAGAIIPTSLPPAREQEVKGCAEAAIRALGIDRGMTHTESKFTADGPRIIEVNLRMGGHLAAMFHHGSDDDIVVEAGKVALGQRPKAPVEMKNFVGSFMSFRPRAAGRYMSTASNVSAPSPTSGT